LPTGLPGRTEHGAALHSIALDAPHDRRLMPDSTVRVAVTGAAGQIGYALLFRIASGEAFGPEAGVDSSCSSWSAACRRSRASRMELEDCAFPLLDEVSRPPTPSGIRGRELGPAGRGRCRARRDGAQGSAEHQRRHLHRPGRGDRAQRRGRLPRARRRQPVQHERAHRLHGAARRGMPKTAGSR
jgi:hypothetical protein